MAQHHDLVDVRNIHALIEQIDSKNIIQFAVFQLFHRFVTFGLRVFAGDGLGPVWTLRLLIHLLVEQVRKPFGFLCAAAEHQTLHRNAGLAVDLDFVDDVAHSIRIGKLLKPTA